MSVKKPTAKEWADALIAFPNKAGRTSQTEAYEVLNAVHEHYAECFGLDPDDTVHGWLGRYYLPMRRNNSIAAETMAEGQQKLGADFPLMVDATRACVWSLYHFAGNRVEMAWTWISDARYLVGLIHGRAHPQVLQRNRSKGGVGRHEVWRIQFAALQPRIDELAAEKRNKNPHLSKTAIAMLIWGDLQAAGKAAFVAGQPVSAKKLIKYLKSQMGT